MAASERLLAGIQCSDYPEPPLHFSQFLSVSELFFGQAWEFSKKDRREFRPEGYGPLFDSATVNVRGAVSSVTMTSTGGIYLYGAEALTSNGESLRGKARKRSRGIQLFRKTPSVRSTRPSLRGTGKRDNPIGEALPAPASTGRGCC